MVQVQSKGNLNCFLRRRKLFGHSSGAFLRFDWCLMRTTSGCMRASMLSVPAIHATSGEVFEVTPVHITGIPSPLMQRESPWLTAGLLGGTHVGQGRPAI